MNRSPAVNPAPFRVGAPVRLSALSLAVLLGGCSTVENMFSNDKVDYRSASNSARGKPLEVPPDLTQLARDSRYQPQGGVVSAAATPTAAPLQPTGAAVAPLAQGDVRVERDGSQRWLVVPMPPEKLWPLLKAFWQERGLPIASENAQTGVMETDWVENRAKLPQDAIRSTIGRLLDGVYDTGIRDRYRTRVERTATGSEVYISHNGMEEIYTGERKESTSWQPRAPDPGLEAEMLSQLMVRLGSTEAVARTAVAGAPELPARARPVSGNALALEVDEPFDRAWRRVGLALDRGGFTVEDRDRAGGLYFVRYIDPKNNGKDEPGWWSKLFSSAKSPTGPEKYRIAVKGSGDKTTVSVLTGSGDGDAGETGRRIVGMLVKELR